ncbi:MAG: hypothetical protein IPM45_06345 [Acidimicrobiales bacterium]|nr:hypothetical protein [Acidimicrobiales bacterium]
METAPPSNRTGRRRGRRRAGRGSLVRLLAVVAAVVIGAVAIFSRSQAAFTATTENNGNSFSAGTVALVDDDSANVMFNASNLKPGDTLTKCITVTYQGSITPSVVKLYGTSAGTGLAQYLNTTVEVGTGGSFASCTGFSASSTVYSGTLAGFSSAHTNYVNGATGFTAAATNDARTFRFTVALADNNLAQGLNATAVFTWEAQS